MQNVFISWQDPGLEAGHLSPMHAQSCPTLCDPVRLLSPWDSPGKNTGVSVSESRSFVSDSLRLHGLYSPWNSPGQYTGVGCRSLLWGIFPTEGLNPCHLCLLYRLAGSLLPAPPGNRTLTLRPPVPGLLVFPYGQR